MTDFNAFVQFHACLNLEIQMKECLILLFLYPLYSYILIYLRNFNLFQIYCRQELNPSRLESTNQDLLQRANMPFFFFFFSKYTGYKHFYQTCSAFDHNPAFLWFIPHFFWGSSNPHEFKDPQILKILGSLKRKRKERGLSLSLPCCPSISSHILSLSPFPRKPLPSFPQYVLPWSLNPQ